MSAGHPSERAYEDLAVGDQLATVETSVSYEDAARLRELLDLDPDPALGGLGTVHLAFLRAVLTAGVVPDGAIMTRLVSRHIAPLVAGFDLTTCITVAAKEVKRGRAIATLAYEISADSQTIAIVDQTVIWPSA